MAALTRANTKNTLFTLDRRRLRRRIPDRESKWRQRYARGGELGHGWLSDIFDRNKYFVFVCTHTYTSVLKIYTHTLVQYGLASGGGYSVVIGERDETSRCSLCVQFFLFAYRKQIACETGRFRNFVGFFLFFFPVYFPFASAGLVIARSGYLGRRQGDSA